MRKLLNKLLIKFGLLITKAPLPLADKSLETFIDLSKQMIDMLNEAYFDRNETTLAQVRPALCR